jgi:hypothetical protein
MKIMFVIDDDDDDNYDKFPGSIVQAISLFGTYRSRPVPFRSGPLSAKYIRALRRATEKAFLRNTYDRFEIR